ncbi:putative RNA-directed DNA polymerase from transposon X-element [Trichonephila clavipes]|nr:putative RNA-directed DNA polymerase from transposon X-element [Trichonephila clavipes]
MVQNRAVDEAVFNVTEAIWNAADAAIPRTSNYPRKLCKPWWNASCQQAKKGTKEGVGIFRRYPTSDNLIAFKRAKALARRIRRQCQRESWIQYVSSITSSTTNVANLIGTTFASVSSSDSYSPAFQATKNRLERTPINFRCRQPLPYNCDFDMFETYGQCPSRLPASLYVDDLQISCEGSDMRLIERQLQTAVNNILKWCDTNGHSISASKSCCVHFCRKRGIHPDPEIRIRDIQIPVVPDVRFLGVIFDRRLTFLPHILHLRKKCEKSLNLLKVLSNTSWGADRPSLLRVYQAIVLSRIDYGCVAYGSACNSTLQKLDPVHHMALRICSGAFRTSPVQSLYVNCHQLPLDLRRRKLSLAYYTKILMKLHISELDLPNVRIQQRNFFLFQPWNTPRFHYINPFATYSKSTVAPVVFQRVFAYHRSQYSRYSAIYTDGSKRADYVGCGVVIEDIMHGYRLDTSCSIFTAEAVAIYRALQLIDSTMPRKYCIYTDSMSVLEALENYHDRCHPVVCTILDITSRLYSKGFDIVFCWLPSHVGIIGNEQADSAAKSATTHLPLAVPLSDMKRVIMHHIFKIWQESWSQQLDNKLHSVKPVIGAWSVMPMRRTDVKLTRLRIGHTRFTHRHLLFGERAPECPSCHVSYTVHHILIDCPVFNHHRITFLIHHI